MIGLVDVFLTNGNGVCHAADPIYTALIRQFSPGLAQYAITSFLTPQISSKLQFERCRTKYRELVAILQPSITSPVVRELIDDIGAFNGPMERMSEDPRIQRKLEAVRTITG